MTLARTFLARGGRSALSVARCRQQERACGAEDGARDRSTFSFFGGTTTMGHGAAATGRWVLCLELDDGTSARAVGSWELGELQVGGSGGC